jgi:predicted nucleic acid-binding protein
MIVLDSSAAVAIVMETGDGQAITELMLSGEEVVSPQLFLAEISSALSKYVRSGYLNKKAALELQAQAVMLVDRFIDLSENYVEAMSEGMRLSHSVYDMLYLTLARRHGATLFTLDKALMRLCEKQGVDCLHILSTR